MDSKTITDFSVASATITAPVWLDGANAWLVFIGAILGIVLATMRIFEMMKRKD
tara:strand:- start:623 stop:784 length:162 start_codon:yes stop_codon:yes gene_type:complete